MIKITYFHLHNLQVCQGGLGDVGQACHTVWLYSFVEMILRSLKKLTDKYKGCAML